MDIGDFGFYSKLKPVELLPNPVTLPKVLTPSKCAAVNSMFSAVARLRL
jgi:hypothetical protein